MVIHPGNFRTTVHQMGWLSMGNRIYGMPILLIIVCANWTLTTGFLTGYDVPSGVRPQMLTVVGNEVWFTGRLPGMVGKLDSTSAGDLIAEINPDAGTLTPTCATSDFTL